MHHAQAGIGFKLDDKITVGDRVQTVPADFLKTEFVGDELTVDIISDTGQRPAAQRHHIHPGQTTVQPFDVPSQHLKISQEMMCQQYRLRFLHVGVAGDNRSFMV